MLNELENKIRKAIPGLNYKFGEVTLSKPIQLNHVLEYLTLINKNTSKEVCFDTDGYITQIERCLDGDIKETKSSCWNLKSNLLSEQPIEVIRFLNELKNN